MERPASPGAMKLPQGTQSRERLEHIISRIEALEKRGESGLLTRLMALEARIKALEATPEPAAAPKPRGRKKVA